jgi:ubiquitin-conjugating enzyme E2 Z
MASVLSKNTLKRILSDVKEIRNQPLTSHGIHYLHDETDVLKGRALIIGPPDTPYADGFYLFKIQFPTNYPHAPPVVEFCTHDNETRFNPNLYRSGKVCLSILNTWKGEQWSGCQTLSSVLLAICTIFNAEPLLNEPGCTKGHPDYQNYNQIIRYKNIDIAIIKMLAQLQDAETETAIEFAIFGEIMREHFQKERENIRQRVAAEVPATAKPSEYRVSTGVYQMTITINYPGLLAKL